MKLSIWIVLGLFFLGAAYNSDRQYIKSIKKHRKERRKAFKDPTRSPLREEAKYFKQLYYFPIDPSYRITATLEKTQDGQIFRIPTNDPAIQKEYISYGKLSFELAGKPQVLTVYKDPRLSRIPMYRDQLFLPFRDGSAGRETYGGGRYLDLAIMEGPEMTIDFNLAYNPNCAYSNGWSCPLPPAENTLTLAIEAGEKDYTH
ncbi:MAG: DUF1684 domain-containing protein [Bacteroidota bacterium]